MDHELHDLPWDDRDDAQAASDLAGERRERTLNALYNAAMIGVPDEDIRHLCSECGIPWRELEQWTHPVLRMPNQQENQSTLDLQAPF